MADVQNVHAGEPHNRLWVKWSEFLTTDSEGLVQFPSLPDFLRSSGSGTGSTQPRDLN
jgi:hypothetical protein